MKKSVSILAGAVMAATTSVAVAQGPSPNLTVAEKAGYTLIEQALSIVAAVVDHTTCAATAANYTFSLSVASTGTGSLTIDDLSIASTNVTTAGQSFRGTLVRTDINAAGEFDDTTVSEDAGGKVGIFGFSRFGDVMYGNADFLLDGSSNAYDEHIVKDFYQGTVFGGSGNNGIHDDGLEVITKLDFPRAKWRQLSRYRRPNGGVGQLSITKELIAPEGFAVCSIQIIDAVVDNAGDGWQLNGTVQVQTSAPATL